MPTVLQFRRGTAAQNNAFTGQAGEITFDTTNNTLRIHDGSTQGGTRLGTHTEVQAVSASATLDSAKVVNIAEGEKKLLDSSRASVYVVNTLKLLDSARALSLISVPVLGTDFVDSAEALKLIPKFGTDYIDSGAANSLIDTRVNATFINNLTIDADTLAGQNGAYYRAYGNLTGTPTIPTLGSDFVDSAEATTIANARITATLIDEDNMGSNSATRLPSQQSVKAYVDAQLATKDNTDEITEGSSNLYFTNARADARIAANIIDEDNMSSNSATRAPSQQSVKAYVDTEVSGLVASAPGALNTLNELAAAIGDDANFSTTITNSIAAKLDSALTTQLIDSSYVQLRTTPGTDSAATNTLADARIAAANISALANVHNASPSDGQALVWDNGNSRWAPSSVGGQITVQEEGSSLSTAATTLNFVGGNITASGSGATKTITVAGIPQLYTDYVDSGEVTKLIPKLYTDYVDSGEVTKLINLVDEDNMSSNSATRPPSQQSVKAYVDANAGSSLTVQEEGSSLSTAATTLNFVGSNVTATGSGATKTITITGSGGIALSDLSGNKGLAYNSGTGVFDVDSANIRGFTVADAINNGTTNIAPSQNAVFDALALKLDASAVPTLGGSFVDSGEARKLLSGGTGITYNSGTGAITTTDGDIVHDNLSGFVANEHIDHSAVSIIAGKGLSGGGTIASNRTLNIDSANVDKMVDSNLADGSVIIDSAPGLSSPGVTISSGSIAIKNSGSVSKVDLYCETGNAHYTRIQSTAHANYSGNVTLTLPATTGIIARTADIPVLYTDYVDSGEVSKLITATLIDEDNMSSNSATRLPSQQSVKAYVDANSGGGSLTIQEEGSSLSTAATTLNFVGSSVTATGSGATKTITISGTGGSTTNAAATFYEYFATSGQTQFSGTDADGSSLSFSANQVQVHHNGILLKKTNDYIESAGNNRITLTSAADSDDILSVSVFGRSSTASITRFKYEADSAQTTFGGNDLKGNALSYSSGNVQVHLNGILLTDSDDYTATNGTQVVLASGADSADIINISTFTDNLDTTGVTALIDSDYVSARSSGGGVSWQSLKTSNYTAVAGQGVLTNTTGGAFTVTLPASPSAGAEVKVVDAYGIAGTNNVTIGRNSSKIHGADSDFIIDINRSAVGFVYVDNTQGWVITEM